MNSKAVNIETLLRIIPEEEKELREAFQEQPSLKETMMDFIGWPTDSWHWDALSEITGLSYDQLRDEMEPYD